MAEPLAQRRRPVITRRGSGDHDPWNGWSWCRGTGDHDGVARAAQWSSREFGRPRLEGSADRQQRQAVCECVRKESSPTPISVRYCPSTFHRTRISSHPTGESTSLRGPR